MVCQPLDEHKKPTGNSFLAVDTCRPAPVTMSLCCLKAMASGRYLV